jgi:hypothetical protein
MPKYVVQFMTDDVEAAFSLFYADDASAVDAVLYQSAPGLPGCMVPVQARTPNSALHFVGFKDDRYCAAVRVFGEPDFVHRTWDKDEIMEGDVAVFATEVVVEKDGLYVKPDPDAAPSLRSWNDSERF